MHKTAKIIVTLSILLNVVLLSFVTVSFFRHQDHKSSAPQISEAAREKIKEKFSKADMNIRPQLQQVRETSTVLKDIIAAPEFDKAAYEKAIDDVMTARQSIARERALKMGEAMADLPAEERKTLSHGLMRSLSPSMDGNARRITPEARERFKNWQNNRANGQGGRFTE